MQLVDLRRPSSPDEPRLEVWASPGAELIRSVAALLDDCELDVGRARVDELRTQLDDDLLTLMQGPVTAPGDGKGWLLLAALVRTLPAPGTVEDLLQLLEDDPEAPWRTLVASTVEGGASTEDEASLGTRTLAGEDVRAEVAAAADSMDDHHGDQLRHLLDAEPVEFGRRVAQVLRRFHASLGGDMVAEAMGAMEREAEARREQHEAGTPLRRLVVEATNGYEIGDGTGTERILLLPSYWFRPWIVISCTGDTEVFTTPIADEHLALPSQAPPPALVRLFKALGDEGRLRLLRRMAAGPISLAEAMDELGVAKTTAHHHLSSLRQAGLVSVREQGRSMLYGLREDPPAHAGEALAAYVGPVARTVVSVAE